MSCFYLKTSLYSTIEDKIQSLWQEPAKSIATKSSFSLAILHGPSSLCIKCCILLYGKLLYSLSMFCCFVPLTFARSVPIIWNVLNSFSSLKSAHISVVLRNLLPFVSFGLVHKYSQSYLWDLHYNNNNILFDNHFMCQCLPMTYTLIFWSAAYLNLASAIAKKGLSHGTEKCLLKKWTLNQ